MFFYDIESRLGERFECRFQVSNARGELVTVRKSCILNTLTEIEKFKESLPDEHMNCLEVVKCRSHQPTLLCVVNSSESLKKHFCETNSRDVIGSFFSWIMTDVLKPTNSKKGQKNDYVFVAHNGSAYDSQFIYRNAHDFFGSRNVNVLIHNNRMLELKIQVNTGFRDGHDLL